MSWRWWISSRPSRSNRYTEKARWRRPSTAWQRARVSVPTGRASSPSTSIEPLVGARSPELPLHARGDRRCPASGAKGPRPEFGAESRFGPIRRVRAGQEPPVPPPDPAERCGSWRRRGQGPPPQRLPDVEPEVVVPVPCGELIGPALGARIRPPASMERRGATTRRGAGAPSGRASSSTISCGDPEVQDPEQRDPTRTRPPRGSVISVPAQGERRCRRRSRRGGRPSGRGWWTAATWSGASRAHEERRPGHQPAPHHRQRRGAVGEGADPRRPRATVQSTPRPSAASTTRITSTGR